MHPSPPQQHTNSEVRQEHPSFACIFHSATKTKMMIMRTFLLSIATTASVVVAFSPQQQQQVLYQPQKIGSTSKTTTSLSMAVNGSDEKKKVIVLGGDGFCGWPTSLYLSDRGHDVIIVDNLSRRKIDLDLGCDSLTPIASPEVRSSPARWYTSSLLYGCLRSIEQTNQ